MASKFPVLIHNPATRVGAEVLIYYNLGKGIKIGTLVKTNQGYDKLQVSSCAGEELVLPTSGLCAAIMPVANQSQIFVSGAINDANFPASAPIGSAIELDENYFSTDIDDFGISGGSVGDQVDIIALPNPANDVLICYDQGFEAKVGEVWKPIPRKYNAADHYVRQRSENTISLKDLMVSNWDGVRRIAGLPVTLIARIYPEGGSAPSEIQYYVDARLSVPPMNSPGDANNSIELSADGKFSWLATFAAQPA